MSFIKSRLDISTPSATNKTLSLLRSGFTDKIIAWRDIISFVKDRMFEFLKVSGCLQLQHIGNIPKVLKYKAIL